ncbi:MULTISPECIES: VC0807 family protein [unclassified Streptomyces]|uniref:VC0807 family protein n=1 Tax=unclassified Streptomyces TaxID=2593676 RepID=UPI004042DB9C
MTSGGSTLPDQPVPDRPGRDDDTSRAASGASSGPPVLLTVVVDFGVPIGLYYGLTAAGVGDVIALTAGAVVPAAATLLRFARTRRVDVLGVFVTVMLVLSIIVSVVGGGPRLLLLRDGWLTGVAGAGFLVSLRGRRPLAFGFSRRLLERRASGGRDWDELWDEDRRFRRIWRVTTVMWGIGLLVDSGVRTLMAYTLPVHTVPALNGAQYGVFTLLMLVIVNIYHARAGLWLILSADSGSPARDGSRGAAPAPGTGHDHH